MSSPILKRSVKIGDRTTSVSLESEFFDALKNIATARQTTFNAIVSELAAKEPHNLSSALRVFALRAAGGVS